MLTLNSAYIDEMYADYLRDPDSVDQQWKIYFQQQYSSTSGNGTATPTSGSNGVSQNGTPAAASAQPVVIPPPPAVTLPVPPPAPPAAAPSPVAPPKSSVTLGAGDTAEPMSGITAKIAENMIHSLNVPTATSVRSIPVKVLEENRRLINKYLASQRRPKVSFTHILAWGIVKALIKYPQLNDAFAMVNGQPTRIKRSSINIGLAADTTRKDGSRLLVVPSVKNSQTLNFSEFCRNYDDLIAKARTGKLSLDELMGASVSLTNPGTIGTVASIPRLMEGQGLIIASGAIEYPAEFMAVMPDVLSTLAISKVITLTSTYDHRIIQGAESGEFLAYLHKLLIGEERFYDQIFATLRIPYEPMKWSMDKRLNPFGSQDELEKLDKEACVAQMIHAYRVRGHLLSNINPLGLQSYYYPELDPAHYGFTIWDLDREFDTGGVGGLNRAPLRDIIDILRDTYCGKIAIEYMYIQDPEKKEWVQKRIEPNHFSTKLPKDEKIHTYRKLIEAEAFEQYLQTKYIGAKRFSLEGGETTITFLDKILELSATAQMHACVIGMAHRGRLNVLANILEKPYEKIFDEFEGNYNVESFQGSGDVKYHLGAKGEFISRLNEKINVILAPNPSHLEAVNPVVEGMARAMDDAIQDKTCSQSVPVLIHGDAAFAGQGIVPETLNLSRLAGYRTGGTINVIINNQIGFTTSPDDARSTTYASDIAKMLQVPILHVNGDDPEAVRTAALFAFEYRQKFNDDVIVDIICYRKWGHNEADEPGYTQPLLYKKIKIQTPVRQLYRQQLLEEKALTSEELDSLSGEFKQELNEAFADRTVETTFTTNKFINDGADIFAKVPTSLSSEILHSIVSKITAVPSGFTPNPKVVDLLVRRSKMLDSETPAIDWAMGEALAFGSMLLDQKTVRMSGQDCGRGTFSHRHAILHDYNTEEQLILLNHLSEDQAHLWLYNSPLSEFAVLGFEYGYSAISTDGLTLWEAQFGDFTNGAQVIIDQFISSAEEKWGQVSNLTMLLPHGYEGQGPEHSSARLERFLQLCAEDNMFVCNFTTPAQYFHALRRQVYAPYRKPMIVMSPKGILRQPISVLSEFTDRQFEEIIDDQAITNPDTVRRVIFCSGKVYYDLLAERTKIEAHDVAIVRVEQLYPFHEQRAAAILERYPKAQTVVWAQEEPKNMGSWSFIAPRIAPILRGNQRLCYAGRNESASPAAGYSKVHEQERLAMLRAAYSVV
ncbi:MAG: multifunctional oxoglutarate decarboxylase/oxoglutarate dehydrogenase thiamine pyrophosphate-binding subunit/dihydrolipoyllysine-residue succinyltransferase subunit [Candidatus Kapaibacterium sp.]